MATKTTTTTIQISEQRRHLMVGLNSILLLDSLIFKVKVGDCSQSSSSAHSDEDTETEVT